MRSETNKDKLERFMVALGNRVKSSGRIYLTGGATAVLYEWRTMTIDIDLKAEPEPRGLFEALALLKDELDINVELASPDDFILLFRGGKSEVFSSCAFDRSISFTAILMDGLCQSFKEDMTGTLLMSGRCGAKD